jgi:uncharacterized integral membrane protein
MAQWLHSGLSTVMSKVLLTVIPAVWVVAMAIVSIQNATPIRLKFFAFESVELPFGVVLSFCVALGMVIGAVASRPMGTRTNPTRFPVKQPAIKLENGLSTVAFYS